MQTRGVCFKPGFTGLTASKPGYSGGRYSTVSGHLSQADSRVMSSPSGGWAEPRSLSHFLHILGHRTLLVARKIRFSCQSKGKNWYFGTYPHHLNWRRHLHVSPTYRTDKGSGPPPLNSLTFRPVDGQLSEVVPFLLLEQRCGMACQAMIRRPRRCRCSRTG